MVIEASKRVPKASWVDGSRAQDTNALERYGAASAAGVGNSAGKASFSWQRFPHALAALPEDRASLPRSVTTGRHQTRIGVPTLREPQVCSASQTLQGESCSPPLPA